MCGDREVNTVVKIAKALYDKSFDHGLPHVERVLKWSLEIIQRERLDVDRSLVEIAVFLHDVGRLVGEPHAYYSALIAEELLKEAKCPENLVREVSLAVKSHSFSYSRSEPPRSTLARVISDADKLDALGLVGFIRVFLYGERHGRALDQSIDHFQEKILKLSSLMNYEYSKKVSLILTWRVKQLLKILEAELKLELEKSPDTGCI